MQTIVALRILQAPKTLPSGHTVSDTDIGVLAVLPTHADAESYIHEQAQFYLRMWTPDNTVVRAEEERNSAGMWELLVRRYVNGVFEKVVARFAAVPTPFLASPLQLLASEAE